WRPGSRHRRRAVRSRCTWGEPKRGRALRLEEPGSSLAGRRHLVHLPGVSAEAEVELEFEALVIEWRGPAPFFYARLPADASGEITRVKKLVTYGWGAIPAEVVIGDVRFTTSLFPKDGTYLLP